MDDPELRPPRTAAPQQTLTATADAWINSGSPSDNKGSDSILKVMSKSGGNLRALVRFNLPKMPQGCNVESATLRLYAKSASSSQRTLQAWQLGGVVERGRRQLGEPAADDATAP